MAVLLLRHFVRRRRHVLAAVVAAAPLVGQNVATAPRGQQLVTVAVAGEREVVGGATCYQQGLTPMRDGAHFVLVVRATFAGPGRTGTAATALELWRSRDGGGTWERATTTRTRGNADGSMVATERGIALLWTASDAGSWSSVWFQEYDVVANEWLGAPECLAEGRGSQDQYFCYDLAATRSGALVAAIGSHRSPPSPPWRGGWSTGMRWRAPGAAQWSELEQVNANWHGVAGNVMARGDVVDFVFRTNPGYAMHGLRSFDVRKATFEQATDEMAMRTPTEGSWIANVGILCGDDTGGRTLLHVLAADEPGRGRLAVSWSRPGSEWRTVDLAEDPPLCAGNENPTHFALARGPGNQVFAYFARKSEEFANLWQCAIEDGVPATAPRVVAKGSPGAFTVISGLRAAGCFSGLHVVATSRTEKQPGGAVSVFGTFPAKAVFAPPPK